MHILDEEAQRNLDILRECLCEPVVYKARVDTNDATKGKSRNRRKKGPLKSSLTASHGDDAEDLADFIDVLYPCQ